jgi:nucleotidyltransferase/DNA polymerase involved in DNA repair
MPKKNIIALVDCDSFFVCCEQKVNPDLKGKPVSVISNKDGCVISRSKEAKKMGVRMGEPMFMAKKEHPKGIYLVANHELYSGISKQVMAMLRDFSPVVEVYSIDEAFVDLTGLSKLYKLNYTDLASHIRSEIKEQLDIDVSIGLSSSKTLAKLASDKAKNESCGVYVIHPSRAVDELRKTSIEEIWGIGRNLTKLFHASGIINAYELVSQSDIWLNKKVGIRGVEMRHELLGETVSPVTNDVKLPKSIQNTCALGVFTSDINIIKNSLNYHIHRGCAKLRRLKAKSAVICIMLRTKDFKIYFEKKVLAKPTCYEWEVSNIVFSLLEKIYSPSVIYRSSGVIFENIKYDAGEQLFLFSDEVDDNKNKKLAQCIDKLESKFGKDIVRTGFTDSLRQNKPDKESGVF